MRVEAFSTVLSAGAVMDILEPDLFNQSPSKYQPILLFGAALQPT